MGNVGFTVSSDGARSSYEIGCLKAIKELGSEVTSVGGAFVGTINACLIAQGSIQDMAKFWRNASKEDLLDAINNVSEKYVNSWEMLSGKEFISQYISYISQPAFSRIHRLISRYIKEDSLRNSETSLAIVGIDKDDLCLRDYTLSDIPHGKLTEYILMSVLFPVISLSDNDIMGKLPYEISPYKAISTFAPSLVLSTDELSRIPPSGKTKMKITLLRPTEMVGMSFRETADEMITGIRLGYIDTLRKVSFSYGNTFYINRLVDEEYDSLKNCLSRPLPGHLPKLVKFILRTEDSSPENVSRRLVAMLKATGIKDGDVYVALTENAADLLGVDKKEKYTDKTLREATMEKMKELCEKAAPDLAVSENVRKIISYAKENSGSHVSDELLAKYFLILFATDPKNYDMLKDFCGWQ